MAGGVPVGIPNDTPMAQAANAALGHADLMQIYWAAESRFPELYSPGALWHLFDTLREIRRQREVDRNEASFYGQ